MPVELIEAIVEKKSEVFISQAETSCSEILDDLNDIINELRNHLPTTMKPLLIRLEDSYIKIIIQSSSSVYKLGLLDGMKIYHICNE